MWKLFLLLFLFSCAAFARDALNLDFSFDIQYQPTGISKEWISIKNKKINGIGATQVSLNKLVAHRIIFEVSKPYDVKGTFKVRTPQRVDGVVARQNSDKVQIILGPHEGCPKEEKRCKPITLEDVGNIELRLDLERANNSSFGVLLFRPFSNVSESHTRPSVLFDDKRVECGSDIESGWFIFADGIKVEASPDTISLCIEKPNGDQECSEDRETEIEVTANQTGKYTVVAWNNIPIKTVCELAAK